MSVHNKKVSQLYGKSDELFLQLSAYYKKLMHDHRKSCTLTIDQKKILKLFNYNNWEQFMVWVNQKLQENRETEGQIKTQLPEIIEQQADLEQSIYTQNHKERGLKCEHLAISNAKLRKQNILLQNKIRAIEESLFSNPYTPKK